MIDIFTSSSLQPSFILDSFICWDLELVEHDEPTTSFGKKQLGNKNQLLTTCLAEKVEHHNELHKPLLQQETVEQLTAWSAQLQQNLCKNKKLVINQEIEKKNFQHGIFKVTSFAASSMRSLQTTACTQQELSAANLEAVQLQELQLSKPFEEQQQKEELEKKEQLVDSQILVESQLENSNFEQRVPDRQLQQNLLQVQNQLQTSNQEQILSQQPSFED